MSYKKTSIFRNKKSGIFVVQPMTRHPTGASVRQGEPVLIPPEQFENRIVSEVIRNLAKYDLPYNREQVPTMSDEEYELFERDHEEVSVLLEDSGLIEIVALSGGPTVAGKFYMREEEIEDRLLNALRAAFQYAE